jgi:hypothetical protein
MKWIILNKLPFEFPQHIHRSEDRCETDLNGIAPGSPCSSS